MHKRVDAQIAHGKGHDNRPHECAGANQSPQRRPLSLIHLFQGGIQIGIVFIHGGGLILSILECDAKNCHRG
jgi:hypothetical protein